MTDKECNSQEQSIIQKVEEELCKMLKVPYVRETRECYYEFTFPSGKVHTGTPKRMCLPAPVQEIMDGFLTAAICQSYENGFKNGYFQGREDEEKGNPTLFPTEIPEEYDT